MRYEYSDKTFVRFVILLPFLFMQNWLFSVLYTIAGSGGEYNWGDLSLHAKKGRQLKTIPLMSLTLKSKFRQSKSSKTLKVCLFLSLSWFYEIFFTHCATFPFPFIMWTLSPTIFIFCPAFRTPFVFRLLKIILFSRIQALARHNGIILDFFSFVFFFVSWKGSFLSLASFVGFLMAVGLSK